MGRFKDAGSDDEAETNIDMSPLIDCVFILLIFFIVTTVFVEETGVEVDKPQAATASKLESNSILLAITKEGGVIYDNRDIKVKGVRSLVQRLVAQDPEIPVIIQADSESKNGLFVEVVDEAKLGGAKKVNIAAQAPGA